MRRLGRKLRGAMRAMRHVQHLGGVVSFCCIGRYNSIVDPRRLRVVKGLTFAAVLGILSLVDTVPACVSDVVRIGLALLLAWAMTGGVYPLFIHMVSKDSAFLPTIRGDRDVTVTT